MGQKTHPTVSNHVVSMQQTLPHYGIRALVEYCLTQHVLLYNTNVRDLHFVTISTPYKVTTFR